MSGVWVRDWLGDEQGGRVEAVGCFVYVVCDVVVSLFRAHGVRMIDGWVNYTV